MVQEDKRGKRVITNLYKVVLEVLFDVLKYYLKVAALVVYVLILFVQGFLPVKYHIRRNPLLYSKYTGNRDANTTNPATDIPIRNESGGQAPYFAQSGQEKDNFVCKTDMRSFSDEVVPRDKQFVNFQVSQPVPQEGIMVNFQVAKDSKISPMRKMDIPEQQKNNAKIKYGDEESVKSYHSMKKIAGPSKDTFPSFPTGNTTPSAVYEDWNHNVRDMLKKKTSAYRNGPPEIELEEAC